MPELISTGMNMRSIFETLVESLPEGVVITDDHDHILKMNARARTLLGTGSRELRGATFRDLWDRREFTATLESAPVMVDGLPRGVLIRFREWKEREVDRARTELLSLAAHQLRTPLTAVKLFAGMLDSDQTLTSEQKEIVKNIEHSNDKMIATIEHFLNLSRSEGAVKTRRIPVDIRRFLEGLVADVQALAALRKITVTLVVTPATSQLAHIDPQLIREVVNNLLENAIQYSRTHSEVLVTLEERQGKWILCVKDTGIGIPEEAKPHILKKNFRAENAKDMREGGNGLGLYMCDIIMESIGGTIWFESEVNKGTSFYISF